jgi:ornithine cyclodeaminase/alanine dehydrogenase
MKNRLLYLSREDVLAVELSMSEVIDALEVMFREKAKGRVEMPPKPGIHPATDAFIHAMPAYIPAMRSAGMKWVSGYPENPKKGLLYINGLLILNDPETGLPTAVMDCARITALRTGAATAVAARYLARPDSEVVGILGCGIEGRTNLEALLSIFNIKQVRVYDIHPIAQESYIRDVREWSDVDIVPVTKAQQAVTGCDIVVTAGPILKTPHATIQASWLEEGAFASLVDFDSYWHVDALRGIDRIFVDDLAQLEYYKTVGYFKGFPCVEGELAELVSGKKDARKSPRERTMTCNLGLALEDMSVAPLVVQSALKNGVGTWLPL